MKVQPNCCWEWHDIHFSGVCSKACIISELWNWNVKGTLFTRQCTCFQGLHHSVILSGTQVTGGGMSKWTLALRLSKRSFPQLGSERGWGVMALYSYRQSWWVLSLFSPVFETKFNELLPVFWTDSLIETKPRAWCSTRVHSCTEKWLRSECKVCSFYVSPKTRCCSH